MKEMKTIYFIWDSKDIDKMVRILKKCGTNESIIEQLVDLELKDGTAVVPYPNGYSTYYGYDLSKDSSYELYKEVEPKVTKTADKVKSTDRVCAECETKVDESAKVNKCVSSGVEVDIDDDLDEYEVTEDPDEAFDIYSKDDPDYDDALETLRVLLHVRDEYRDAEYAAVEDKLGGLNEGDYLTYDYSILSSNEGFEVVETDYPSIFSFATEKMAEKFLENFEDELAEVSDEIGYFM